MFKVGDFVTRKSDSNDILFRITSINGDVASLSGVDVRLYASSNVNDLILNNVDRSLDRDLDITNKFSSSLNLDRDNYFYLPGVVVHIDSDSFYIKRSIKFYNNMDVKAYTFLMKESEMASQITSILNKYKPDILVITGHDALLKDKTYENSGNFIDTVLKAREYEKSQEKLIIIAGACQSDYESLIRAGANFASSPKRTNIHALDPAIIASSISLSPKNKEIDLMNVLKKTKYGTDGVGGIITNGTMYVGFPR